MRALKPASIGTEQHPTMHHHTRLAMRHVLRRCGRSHCCSSAASMLSVSDRVLATDAPCIVKTKAMMAGRQGVLSLAQGIVHWPPPPAALQTAVALLASDASIHGYGPAEGLPALREALQHKVQRVNGLTGYDIMVTAGANQAFVNVVLSLCDEQDSVVLFRPYYFNHLMALQMTGGSRKVEFGDCDPATMHPSLEWLSQRLSYGAPPKMVVLVNPCNPTGVLMSREEVQQAADLCAQHGTWLVLDNTYEKFVYEGQRHYCVGGPNIINLFSFSKACGMMGWRVGYIAYPTDARGSNTLGPQLLKVQDTIPICPSQLSQHIALAALQGGEQYVAQHIAALAPNRAAIADALSPLGQQGAGIAGGEGAIYYWAKLPDSCSDDEAVVKWLIEEAGVCLIPGSACGAPGYIRAAYANLQPEVCAQAAARLKQGLQRLVAEGPAVLAAKQEQPVSMRARQQPCGELRGV